MRKPLDKIALYAILTAAAFALFLYAYRALIPALLMSAAFLLGLINVIPRVASILSKRGARRAKREAMESRMLKRLLYAPHEEALSTAKRAALKAYGYDEKEASFDGKSVRFALFQRHPDGFPVDASDIAQLYRENRGADALIVLNTGVFDDKARKAAEAYSSPRLTLFDARQLKPFLGRLEDETADGEEPSEGPKKKRRFPRITMNKRMVKRSAVYAVLLMALYLVLGINAYLYASLFLLALALIGRKAPRAPEKLF